MTAKKTTTKKPTKKKTVRKAGGKKKSTRTGEQRDMLAPAPDSLADLEVPAGLLAELFELTQARVRQLADENVIVKVARGRYALKASVQGYCRYLKNTRDGSESKKSEETRLTKVRAESYELELAIKRREFYPADDVDQALLHAATTLTTTMDGAASRIASQIGGGGALRRKLIDEFNHIRNSFAKSLRRFSASLQSDGWNSGAAAGSRARRVGKKKPNSSTRKR